MSTEFTTFEQEQVTTTKKTRAWRFTLNNYTDEEEAALKVLENVKYMVFGHEIAPTTLTPHLQGYIYFKNDTSFTAVKKINPRMAWFNANASAEANRNYCTKEDTARFFETGIMPLSKAAKAKKAGDSEIDRYEQAWAAAKSGDLESVPVDIRIKCYRTLKEIKKDYMPKGTDLTELDNLWIWGPPGCGKSTTARRMCNNEFYPKQMNKWWDGYQNEEVVIIDDWELESHLGHHLKNWADHFSFLAETKGGMLQIRPKRIIITSNYSLHDCFPESELQKAVLRRFKIQHMGEDAPPFHPFFTPYISPLVVPNSPLSEQL
jgi:hypothetical protein